MNKIKAIRRLRRHKKRMRLLAVLTAFLLVAASCGSDSDTSAVAQREPAAEEPAAEEPAAEEPAAEEPAAEEPAAEPIESADLTVALGWIKNVQYAGTWIGLDRGYFDDQAINLTVNAGGPNAPDPVVSVVSGDADIGNASGMSPLMKAITEDNDIVIFGAGYQDSPGGVVSLAARPVLVPEDLIGIKFLGQPPVQQTLEAVFELNNLDGELEAFIPAGFDPQPLIDGDGEAYSAFLTNQAVTLEIVHGLELGVDFFTVPWSELGLPQYSNVFFAERSWLEENRDVAVRFLAALMRGWTENEKDPAYAAGLAVNVYGANYGLDIAQQVRQNEIQLSGYLRSPVTDANGLFSVDRTFFDEEILPSMAAAGQDAPSEIGAHIDTSIVADAVALVAAE